MTTPYAQGLSAGYRNDPLSSNPYLKGLAPDTALQWAMDWIRGYIEGAYLSQDDLAAKHREGTR